MVGNMILPLLLMQYATENTVNKNVLTANTLNLYVLDIIHVVVYFAFNFFTFF